MKKNLFLLVTVLVMSICFLSTEADAIIPLCSGDVSGNNNNILEVPAEYPTIQSAIDDADVSGCPKVLVNG